MQTVIVPKKYNGKKLDSFLYHTFPGLTKNVLYKTLRKKDIRINNFRVNDNAMIYAGDEVQVFIADDLLYPSLKYETIYEDEHILVVFKPAQIEVVGQNSFTEMLQKSYSFLEPCHRLDRNTTGLLLYAKDPESLTILLDKFKNQEIEKHYLAHVHGIPKNTKQTLTAYLFKDQKKSMVYISDEPKKGYFKIITSYTLLEKNISNNTSILDIELHTGKTHQIRAHLAHIDLPIIGDGKYGINEINKKLDAKIQQLCSYSLQFHFSTPSGHLDYLNEKKISLDKSSIPWYEKRKEN